MPVLFVVLALAPPLEARFDVLVEGKKAGVATYRLSDRTGGGRVTRLRIVLADGSISESRTETDAAGAAVRSQDTVARGRTRSATMVTYNARGDATIVVDKGKPIVVPFRARGNRKDPSELWFRSVVPSANTWAVYLALDPRKRTWEEVRVTYLGKRGGGHLVRQVRKGATTSFTLDDRGVPLSIEAAKLRLVRR